MKMRRDFLPEVRGRRDLVSSKHNNSYTLSHGAHNQAHTQYQCPIKCEGEKTYPTQGCCPGSGMQLIPVGGGHIFY